MTQKEAVLEWLKTDGSITSMEAFEHLGITRLSAVVFDLRKLGYVISSEDMSITNRYGKQVHFARYRLEGEPC